MRDSRDCRKLESYLDAVDVETYSLGRGRRYGNTLDVTPLMTSERTLQQSVAGTRAPGISHSRREVSEVVEKKILGMQSRSEGVFFIGAHHEQFSNARSQFDKTNGEPGIRYYSQYFITTLLEL